MPGKRGTQMNKVKRTYQVTVTTQREYAATISIWAGSQAEADRKALAAFDKFACEEGFQALPLGLPLPWQEHDSIDGDPKIDTRCRCVDCGEDKDGEYYTVADEVWAASGLAPNGGMLCLACLEQRIGRLLVPGDFTMLRPSDSAWERHTAARAGCAKQLEIWAALERYAQPMKIDK
jgi:hypothetical protein